MLVLGATSKAKKADARLTEKEFFKVLTRASVRTDASGQYVLRYYPTDRPDRLDEVSLEELKTEDSSNDDTFKFRFVRFCCYIAVLMYAGLFTYEALRTVQSIARFDDSVLYFFRYALPIVAITFLLIEFAFMNKALSNNFKDLDKVWTNSMEKFFGADVRERMRGVRMCILTFRVFIKWRRFTNFFNHVFMISLLAALPVTLAALYLAKGSIDPVECIFFCVLLLGLWRTSHWYDHLVKQETNWRDPTVQLSVMIAELHERYVTRNLMGAGAPQAADRK